MNRRFFCKASAMLPVALSFIGSETSAVPVHGPSVWDYPVEEDRPLLYEFEAVVMVQRNETDAAMAQIAEQLPNKTVFLNYDQSKPVGCVSGARLDQGKIVASGFVTNDYSGMFIGPGYKGTLVKEDGKGNLFLEDIEVLCAGLFHTHADDVDPAVFKEVVL